MTVASGRASGIKPEQPKEEEKILHKIRNFKEIDRSLSCVHGCAMQKEHCIPSGMSYSLKDWLKMSHSFANVIFSHLPCKDMVSKSNSKEKKRVYIIIKELYNSNPEHIVTGLKPENPKHSPENTQTDIKTIMQAR